MGLHAVSPPMGSALLGRGRALPFCSMLVQRPNNVARSGREPGGAHADSALAGVGSQLLLLPLGRIHSLPLRSQGLWCAREAPAALFKAGGKLSLFLFSFLQGCRKSDVTDSGWGPDRPRRQCCECGLRADDTGGAATIRCTHTVRV